MRYLVAAVILISGAWIVATSGCFSIVERDESRCNAEFPCADNLACISGYCFALDGPLPDGFTLDGLIVGMCTTTAECTNDDQPLCTNKMCAACTGTADDGACRDRNHKTPRCGTAGRCVACRTATQDSDCGGTTPICTTDGACRKCLAHGDCLSGVCKSDGSCAMPNEVAYVDNRGMTPTACALLPVTKDGTSLTNAFCDIKDGAGTAKSFVYAAGSAAAYNAVSIVDGTLNKNFTIVGPGRDQPGNPALISETNKVGFGIAITNGNSTIVLDGIEIGDRTALSGLTGVSCSNSGSGTVALTLLRSAVQRFTQVGINSNGCNLTLASSRVSGNAAGGLNIAVPQAAQQYTLVNNFIVTNTGGPALILSGQGSGTVAFNTIAKNQALAGVGGIDCGNGISRTISASIVWDNTKSSNTQFIGGGATPTCVLSNVVTGSDMIMGDIEKTPDFVNVATLPFDFHLKKINAANQDCCVDKIMNPTFMFSSSDADGTTRPLGMAHDIGAHEVE